jgi:tellurium resistance protein TerD
MTLNLNKGDSLDFSKAAPSLATVAIGAGWDPKEGGPTMDADLAAVLLNADGKMRGDGDLVFFNQLTAPGVTHTGDNLTGEGDGDDETINVSLADIPTDVVKIVFAVNIYNAKSKGQSLADIDNAHVRAVNTETNEELAIFKIDKASGETMSFGALVRNSDGWEFQAVNETSDSDLTGFISTYR